MEYVTGNKLGKEICDALGLKHCNLLDIHIDRNSFVEVTARMYPDNEGIKQLPAILQKYRLLAVGEPEEVQGEVVDGIEETTCMGEDVANYAFGKEEK